MFDDRNPLKCMVFKTKDIVLSTMLPSDTTALQYAYLHPLVSGKADRE